MNYILAEGSFKILSILPRMPFIGSPWSESTPDLSGAVSLKSIISADRLRLSYTIMKPPPPIPVECMLMTPTQSVVATAASTADPPFLRIFLPTLEHSALSDATAACRYANCFVGILTFVGLLSKWLTITVSLINQREFCQEESLRLTFALCWKGNCNFFDKLS